VLAPDGQEVPYYRLPARPPSQPWWPAVVTEVEETVGGWSITLDTGDEARAHEGLALDFDNPEAMPRVIVEAGAGTGAWTPVAETTLFRLGPDPRLTKTEVSYTPTRDRYLRIQWPRSSGPPALRSVTVRAAEAAPREPRLEAIDLHLEAGAGGAPGGATYVLRIPGRRVGPGRLDIGWSGAGAVGYRLRMPEGGSWTDVAVGSAIRGERPQALTVPLSRPLLARELRLELVGGGQSEPLVDRAAVVMEPLELVFHAPEAGEYALAYGGIGFSEPRYPAVDRPQDWWSLPITAPGEERRLDSGVPPLAAASSGGAMTWPSPWTSWPVVAAGVRPGELVRLALPPKVYEASTDGRLDGLRVVQDGVQLPYVGHSDAAPASAARMRGVRPAARVRAGTSGFDIELPAARLPLRQVELSAPAQPFTRRVTATWLDLNGTNDRGERSASAEWVCPGRSVLPCSVVLPIAPTRDRRLRIDIEDGDNAPLARIDADVWMRSDSLFFSWPDDAPASVELVTLARAPAPRYDLGIVADELVEWPHGVANLSTVADTGEARPEASENALLVGALLVAAIVMIAVLSRLLPSAEGGFAAEPDHDRGG
jgi:hypothetical protein